MKSLRKESLHMKRQQLFATANETLTTNCVHVHGPAPKASIIRKSASIIAIVTLLKMIGIVPKPVRSFMKPLIAQINPIMDKTTDPTNSTSELDGAVNSI